MRNMEIQMRHLEKSTGYPQNRDIFHDGKKGNNDINISWAPRKLCAA